MQGLKGSKMAMVFIGIGVAAGIGIALAIVSTQTNGEVITRVAEDDENPFLDPEFLKTYQTQLRTGAQYKTQVAVGEEAYFRSDAKGGQQPYAFEWKFSDGVVLTGANSTRTFDTSGTYNFDLTVTDSGGKTTGSTDMKIRVVEAVDE